MPVTASLQVWGEERSLARTWAADNNAFPPDTSPAGAAEQQQLLLNETEMKIRSVHFDGNPDLKTDKLAQARQQTLPIAHLPESLGAGDKRCIQQEMGKVETVGRPPWKKKKNILMLSEQPC